MIASVIQGILEPEHGSRIEVDSPRWFAWLAENKSFRYESNSSAPFTVRKEKSDYWYGYRKIAGKLHKRYIGRTAEINAERLEAIGEGLSSPSRPQLPKVTEKVTEEVAEKVTEAVTQEATQVTENRIAALEARLQLVEELLGKLQANDSSIESLRPDTEEIEKLRASLERSDTLIRLRNQEIAELNSRLTRKDEIIAECNEEIEQLKSQVATASKKISELEGENSEQFAELKKQGAEIEELKSELARRSEGKSEKSATASQDLPDAVNLSEKAGDLLSFFKTLLPKNTKLPSSTISKIEKILEE